MLTGPLVFVIALTGAFYAFQDEIQDLIYPYRYCNEFKGLERQVPSAIIKKAKTVHPNKQVHAILYDEPGRPVKVIFYSFEKYYRIVYVHPQSARILADVDQETGFFPWILKGHFYLWLPNWLGQPIVAWSTLIFSVVLISGLFVWWSRGNWRPSKWRLKQTRNVKRRNYDWHTLIGFYVSSFGLLFATTGLVWGFVWFAGAYYTVSSGGKQLQAYAEPQIRTMPSHQQTSYAIDQIFELNPVNKGTWLEIHPPESRNSGIAWNVNYDRSTYHQIDYHYSEPTNLKELAVTHHWGRLKKANFADTLQRANYDIHVGSILGFPGKCLAFLASLLIASLPLTGLKIYLNRKKLPKLVMKNKMTK
jgi:uncharacterized iron-regulated membrane protein